MIKRRIILLFVFFSYLTVSKTQDMDNEKLGAILYTLSDQIEGQEGGWQFMIDSVIFICVTDEFNNRMRVISPIIEVKDVPNSTLEKCMEANFHSALDARYAISDGLIWAAYIHPLKEHSKDQVISAVSQVYSCVLTYGTLYSSGELAFPKQENQTTPEENTPSTRPVQKF